MGSVFRQINALDQPPKLLQTDALHRLLIHPQPDEAVGLQPLLP